MKTTAVAEESAVAKMAKLVEEAHQKRSRTQRMIEEFAKYYSPSMVALCFVQYHYAPVYL